MADPSITIRVNPEIKAEIQAKVDDGEFRSITDFINKAIVEKIERDRIDDKTRFKLMMLDLIRSDEDIRKELNGIAVTATLIYS